MQRIERAERHREGLGRPYQDGPLEEDKIDSLQPVVNRRDPERRLLGRKRILEAHSIKGSGALDAQQLAGNKRFTGLQVLESPRLA